MKVPPVQTKTVLVTGCSSGIGLATAKVLRERGWEVVPTARKEADLTMLRNAGFEPVELDLTCSRSVQAAADQILSRFNGQLGAIVNNAGFGLTAAMEDCSRDMLRSIFDVNLFGLQELTNQFIPTFRKQGYGRIVNISSVLGELSLPFAGAYSASKFAVEAASDALRRELFDSGVGVSIVQPGPIESNFSKNVARRTDLSATNPNSPFITFYNELLDTRKEGTAGRTAEGFMKPPEAVGEKVLRCLERSRPPRRVGITLIAVFTSFARRFLPAGLIDFMMMSALRKKLH